MFPLSICLLIGGPVTKSLRFSVAAALLLAIAVSGCSNGSAGSDSGTTSPPPSSGSNGGSTPPTSGSNGGSPTPDISSVCDAGTGGGGAPGGIWVGEPQGDAGERMLLLAAETGEFRWLPPDRWSQMIAGNFQIDDTGMSATGAVWARVNGLTWLETEYDLIELWARLDELGGIDVNYLSSTGDSGTWSLASYDTLYQRGSSLATLAGTYTTENTTLAIDDEGAIFYQRGSCVGNGRAGVIDPAFNMYRIEIEVESCTGNTVHAPGRPFTGLAYLSDSGVGASNDVLEFALCSANANDMIFWSQTVRR